MKTEWDYSEVAKSYIDRPEYSYSAIEALCDIAKITNFSKVCDVGAGVAHLTLQLAKNGIGSKAGVVAVEPNNEMRKLGKERTKEFQFIEWHEGTGEKTDQKDNEFDIVTFGSSFNVTDRNLAIKESVRIAKKEAWFACMWNHRDLDDEHQKEIETIIKDLIPHYDYGSRRESQHDYLVRSGAFKSVLTIEGDILHKQSIESCITAWKSHVTLKRQAGDNFNNVISEISKYLNSLEVSSINIPYRTRIYMGKISR
jgi:ubiquinone/menaquinone biosynthesis C-methylase UbiE